MLRRTEEKRYETTRAIMDDAGLTLHSQLAHMLISGLVDWRGQAPYGVQKNTRVPPWNSQVPPVLRVFRSPILHGLDEKRQFPIKCYPRSAFSARHSHGQLQLRAAKCCPPVVVLSANSVHTQFHCSGTTTTYIVECDPVRTRCCDC